MKFQPAPCSDACSERQASVPCIRRDAVFQEEEALLQPRDPPKQNVQKLKVQQPAGLTWDVMGLLTSKCSSSICEALASHRAAQHGSLMHACFAKVPKLSMHHIIYTGASDGVERTGQTTAIRSSGLDKQGHHLQPKGLSLGTRCSGMHAPNNLDVIISISFIIASAIIWAS